MRDTPTSQPRPPPLPPPARRRSGTEAEGALHGHSERHTGWQSPLSGKLIRGRGYQQKVQRTPRGNCREEEGRGESEAPAQGDYAGFNTGNGVKLSYSQAEPDQANCMAVA